MAEYTNESIQFRFKGLLIEADVVVHTPADGDPPEAPEIESLDSIEVVDEADLEEFLMQNFEADLDTLVEEKLNAF
jgi:hypothetical protein